ncbi:MAG: cytochrome-c peroxidase, partial [Bacteroidia bacterium]|nr:cytochrome-c peroxidase [Bacteroidia bacterium]
MFLLATFIVVLSSCKKDDDNSSALDSMLVDALETASGGAGTDFFKLPQSHDFASIPQDPNNPLTAAKVTLGQLLFHETALGTNPKHAVSTGTYSCASCHFAGGGFQANRQQGISDGGIGFGINGEARTAHPSLPVVDCDVQPIRTPSAMNGAYQKNMLWNGQFGATGKNAGTQAQWTAGTPIENNFLGYEGLEIQAIAGLSVHRMMIDSAF